MELQQTEGPLAIPFCLVEGFAGGAVRRHGRRLDDRPRFCTTWDGGLAAAAEELLAADHLLEAELARIALTRAYFAAFHGIRALLYAEDLAPRSHEGVQHLFNVHFVKTGRFPPATSRLVARLQKFREEADYAQAFVVDGAGAAEEIEASRKLVQEIRRLVDEA